MKKRFIAFLTQAWKENWPPRLRDDVKDQLARVDETTPHCPVFVQQRELRAALHSPYFSSFYVPAFFKDVEFELTDGE
ncbi:MAG: hypothetical protein NTX75_16695 [Proteobacteria bacterium]|nr:hypothetical protein [Pseudomonadota bacterium]